VNVMVEDPEPGAFMDAGLNAAVAPAGSPDALREMAESKPPETAVVIVLVPLAPRATETEPGKAEIVKAGGAVTVRVTVDVCVVLPAAPVTVILYAPVATVEATAIVITELPAPGAAMEVGLKVTVTPVGWPLAVTAIAEFSPPETAVVTVDVPVPPCATETEPDEVAMVKLGGVAVPVSASSSPTPFGLPQPVTRSYPVTAE
jgi:hypothetical protein